MMSKNPFRINEETLDNGFYYDISKNLICFLFKDEGDDYEYPSTEIYNRFTPPSSKPKGILGLMQQGRYPHESLIENLVELNVNLLDKADNILEDFKWLNSNQEVEKTFIDFLLKNEKYLILQLYKTFKETKKEKA